MASQLKLAVLGLALAATAQAAPPSPPAPGSLFCCHDGASGRRVCADDLPPQCRGREYTVLDRGGNVVKTVAAPMTADQKSQAATEADRKKAEVAAALEQRRKDQALLNTYSSLAEIDQAQKWREAEVQDGIKKSESEIASLRQQRRKYEAEAEFYRNKPLPPDLKKSFADIDADIQASTETLNSKKAEIGAVRAKFDDDRQRFIKITGSGRQGASSAPR